MDTEIAFKMITANPADTGWSENMGAVESYWFTGPEGPAGIVEVAAYGYQREEKAPIIAGLPPGVDLPRVKLSWRPLGKGAKPRGQGAKLELPGAPVVTARGVPGVIEVAIADPPPGVAPARIELAWMPFGSTIAEARAAKLHQAPKPRRRATRAVGATRAVKAGVVGNVVQLDAHRHAR